MQRLAIIFPWTDARSLVPALVSLVALNIELIKLHKVPHIYASGVVYRGEERTRAGHRKEHWLTAPVAYEIGHADCEDLASWLAACYRLEGEPAMAIPRKNSMGGYHIVTRRADGTVEDPSAVLGMGRSAYRRG